ncbi:SitA5 family polymorphic toxin [Archangium lipolyticum]
MLLSGCGTTTHAVHLDSGHGRPFVHVSRGGQESVRLREGELEAALAELVRDVRPEARPLRHARELMFESWRQDVYLEWMGRSLVPGFPEARGPSLDSTGADALTSGYGRWCRQRGHHRGDCLSLLKDNPTFDVDGRYTLAMAIATDVVWNEAKAALAELADPEAVRATIVSAMTMYMMLWVLPEPVSKTLAATLTAGLIAYLGIDTVRGLIGGWVRLVGDVDRATTFEELRDAGERYGKVMGRHAARAFVLLATAAIGNTTGLATKGPGLPGYSQAAVLAETQAGFRMAALGEVRSVAVSAEGSFTIAFAPHAVAMTAQGPGSRAGSSSQGSLTGRPTRPEPNDDDPVNIKAIERKNESARILADNGYHVEQNPVPKPNGKKPDYKVDGEYYDCYAPTSSRARNIADHIWKFKVEPGQAERIILNLDDSGVALGLMRKQLEDWPIPGLKAVLVIRGGKVIRLFP